MEAAHHRFAVAILALLAFPVPAWGAVREEDPLGFALGVVRKRYSDAVAAAMDALRKAFDDEIKKVDAKGDLDGVKALLADKEKAEREDDLQDNHPLRKHQLNHNAWVLNAKAVLAKELSFIVKQYTLDLEPGKAAVIRIEIKKLSAFIKAEWTIRKNTEAILLRPDDPDLWYKRSFACLQRGKYDRAIKDLSEAIELDPDKPLYWALRGAAHDAKDHLDLAIKDFTELIKLTPDHFSGWSWRGLAYRKKGEYDLAIKDFSEVIRMRPGFAEHLVNRGVAYDAIGDLDLAIKDFSEAIKWEPEKVSAWKNRGAAYKKKGNDVQAQADFKKAKELEARARSQP